jgi:hypothetical protein
LNPGEPIAVTRKSTGGFVLPMVVIALAMMGVLVVAVLTTGDDDRQSAVDFQEGTRSFYAADAGLNQMLAQWTDSTYDTRVAAAGAADTFAWRTLPENGAVYRAVIQRLASGGAISLSVDGRSAAARRGLRTVQVILTAGPGPFNYAVLGGTSVSFSGGTTDSWDSRLGAYAASNCATLGVTCDGDIGSNGTVSLSGGAQVKGDANAVGTISGCAGRVTGTCTTPAAAVGMAGVSCPAGFSSAAAMPVNPGTYTAATGALTMNAGSTLTLNAANSPFRWSDATIRSTITIPAGSAHIDIYVSGTLTITAGGLINNLTQDPTKLTIWGCGNSATTWDNKAGSASYMAVYAPSHPVTVSGSGAFYGAIVGASASNSGGAAIHFDEALRAIPSIALTPGSWAEVAH